MSAHYTSTELFLWVLWVDSLPPASQHLKQNEKIQKNWTDITIFGNTEPDDSTEKPTPTSKSDVNPWLPAVSVSLIHLCFITAALLMHSCIVNVSSVTLSPVKISYIPKVSFDLFLFILFGLVVWDFIAPGGPQEQ